ncbi:hypothetical protein GGR51DRAFT_556149 [Nemania sp. FL0031]|nr:hypothetical protein GGR51DRAFT_556149 [Nemania sp. FL0031]
MPRRVPLRRLSGANNNHTNNIYNTDQSRRNTFFAPSDLSLQTDYTPDVRDLLLTLPAIPLPASTGQNTEFPYPQLSMVPQLDVLGVHDAFGDFTLYPLNGSVPAPAPVDNLPASSSPSSSVNGSTARVVSELAYEDLQGSPVPISWPPLASMCDVSPPTVITSPENEKLPSYQCLECPNMPKFSSQKDLDRHYITSKAHWSENTQFYRCCCAAYDRPRKDHHLRHVQFCKAAPQTPYTCTCGRQCWAQGDHVEHVTNCRRGRPGRRTATP